jgi:Cys-rich four helix bundle protein (predicted Tat secretion target)
MQRREFLTKSALLSAAALAAPSLSFAAGKAAASGNSLLDAATDCNKKAELCLQHCVDSLGTGNKAMAACAVTVRDMMIYCEALAKASARKSKHLSALAKIAEQACRDCEAECRKHKQMQVCLDCADACAACAKECASA